jgi:Family of unknown function (DUF6496)
MSMSNDPFSYLHRTGITGASKGAKSDRVSVVRHSRGRPGTRANETDPGDTPQAMRPKSATPPVSVKTNAMPAGPKTAGYPKGTGALEHKRRVGTNKAQEHGFGAATKKAIDSSGPTTEATPKAGLKAETLQGATPRPGRLGRNKVTSVALSAQTGPKSEGIEREKHVRSPQSTFKPSKRAAHPGDIGPGMTPKVPETMPIKRNPPKFAKLEKRSLRSLKGGGTDKELRAGHNTKGGKVEKVMHEFKAGSLRSGSKKGPKVQSRSQAIAIGLSEARKAGEKVPAKK